MDLMVFGKLIPENRFLRIRIFMNLKQIFVDNAIMLFLFDHQNSKIKYRKKKLQSMLSVLQCLIKMAMEPLIPKNWEQ